MREKPKYFILNNESDFEKGCLSRGLYWNDGLTVSHNTACLYYSGVYDSCGKETVWYKFMTEYELPDNTFCDIAFYSAENMPIFDKKEFAEADEQEKERMLKPYLQFETPLKEDILLTSVKGRYLWFRLKFTSSVNSSPFIKSMKLYFGGSLWIENMPEIYRTEENGFTQRFLGIFQTLFEDMERKIERTAENYTAENASPEFLQWLSEWYCIRERGLWNEEQLRYILENAWAIYRKMGTKSVIEELCGLYLGEKPEIIEYYMSEDSDFENKWDIENERIFINPYVFTVLVREKCIESSSRYNSLVKIIESCKPAHMEANIIIISESSDRGGYIGINSYISARDGENLSGKTAAMLTEKEGLQ